MMPTAVSIAVTSVCWYIGWLQERFRYCGAKMLPKGSMGYVEPGDLPPTGKGVEAQGMSQ